jgi:Ca2+-binding RTX toxin-like protein
VLKGGSGQDMLSGGTGADRFVFVNPGDSSAAPSAHDTIADFSHSDGDRIDLGAIDANGNAAGNAAFHFASAFDSTAGALTVTANGSDWEVQGDLNGDNIADFAITVVSNTPLVEADFVL